VNANRLVKAGSAVVLAAVAMMVVVRCSRDEAASVGVAPTVGGEPLSPETAAAIERTRENYEEQLDAKYAAARGFVDAILTPEDTRAVLSLALRCSLGNPGPHLGPFTLPDGL